MRTFAASYDLVLGKDWWGFSEVPLCSPVDSYVTMHFKLHNFYFCYFLFIVFPCAIIFCLEPLSTSLCFTDLLFPHHVVCPFKSKVRIFISKEGRMSDLDVEALDVYFNLTFPSTQLMNREVPRSKDFESM